MKKSLMMVLFSVVAAMAVETNGTVIANFEHEKVATRPVSFIPAVGNWIVGEDDKSKVLVVDGRRWKSGEASSGIAEQAKSLYGERYAEFLDNVKAFAYYPYAVAKDVENFTDGEISMKFKGIDGRIDQAAGILFDLKQNGDYLAIRANPLENNLVLWKFERGKRSSVKWVRDVKTTSNQWHSIKLVVKGTKIEGWVNGALVLTHENVAPISGRVGIWSKADSVVYFDDYIVSKTQL